VRRSKNRPRNFGELDRKWQIYAKTLKAKSLAGLLNFLLAGSFSHGFFLLHAAGDNSWRPDGQCAEWASNVIGRFSECLHYPYKGTVSLVNNYLKVISFKSPRYGHMALGIDPLMPNFFVDFLVLKKLPLCGKTLMTNFTSLS
jgi:hypothetical protein